MKRLMLGLLVFAALFCVLAFVHPQSRANKTFYGSFPGMGQ